MLGNDGYSDILVQITTAGDLSGISGAESRGLWKGKASETRVSTLSLGFLRERK